MQHDNLRIDFSFEKHLAQSGLRRVMCGHRPIGDSPLLLKRLETEIIMANTTNSDSTAADKRGKAVAEVLVLENGNSYFHGTLQDGVPYHFEVDRFHEKFIGRKTRDGYWIKARVENGRYSVMKIERDRLSTAYRTEEELLNGHISIPVAAAVWKNVKNKKEAELAFLRAALSHYIASDETGSDVSLQLPELDRFYDVEKHDIAITQLIGCMLLEANDYDFTPKLVQKIGGRSPLTATCLKGKAATNQLMHSEEADVISVIVHTPEFLKPPTGWMEL